MDGWTKISDYGWTHPTGWTIDRYFQNGVENFMLWHGTETQGRRKSFAEVVALHRELVANAGGEHGNAS
ncbi:conserved hypothetical protein [Burkholderia latens]|uniref:hypothetical protein n=1 Tax=Burkholderia latens TaxID=488446 RepID=UPI0039A5BB1F